ncbi:effector-associated domain 2-containing protein [Kibdelosporangium phytohabitans]|uniref:VMAP-C domain-containing protein n=1 Tax=Kibdelosporangium phytohabitans TaxID=860235 RepID=UPI00269217AE
MAEGGDVIPARGPLWPLVRALLRVGCLADLNGRNLVVRIVSDELDHPLLPEEHPQCAAHLFSIVETCHHRPDGLPALLFVLEQIEPGTKAMAEVRRIITEMSALDTWSPGERRRLFAVLAGVVVPDIARIYQTVAGANAPQLRAQTTYSEVFLALETLNAGPDGVPKPLIFVEHLAVRVRSDLAAELRRWGDEQAARMGVAVELRAVRKTIVSTSSGASAESGANAYLVFQLQYEGPSTELYRLCHWRQRDLSIGWYPKRGSDFVGKLDEIKHRVASLVEAAESDWAPYEVDIRVEFFLPRELLNLDVDQWQWEAESDFPEPMGCHFPVCVRSLERMVARKWHRQWYIRWKRLMNQVRDKNVLTPEAGFWSKPGDQPNLRQLTSYFEREPVVVAHVLAAPPAATPASFDEVAVGLRAGIPVMVWHREDCGIEEFVATAKDLLHAEAPGRLLDRVRLVRADAFANDARQPHVGSHLAVLWDDPERVVVPDRPGPPEEVD